MRATLLLACCISTAALAGPGLKRTADMPDGAPAFDVLDAEGRRIARIECIQNGWYRSDDLAARLLSSPAVMAAIAASGARIDGKDLGPAQFDCVVKR